MLILEGEHAVTSLAFTPDGTRLVAVWNGGNVDVWTLATRERTDGPVMSNSEKGKLAVHPSGRTVFLAGGQALTSGAFDKTFWVLHTGAGVIIDSVIVSPDGKWVIAGPAQGDGNRFLGAQCRSTGRLLKDWKWTAEPHAGYERLGGFVDRGAQFLTVGDKLFVLRDTKTGAVRSTVKYPSGYVRSITVSANGGLVAVQGFDLIYVWNTATWGKPLRITGFKPFESLVFHPTCPLLAGTQPGSRQVTYLDASTGKTAAKFDWDVGKMQSVCFSPDGTLAAAGSTKGKIVVWDVDP